MLIFCTNVFRAAFLCLEICFEQGFVQKKHAQFVDEIDRRRRIFETTLCKAGENKV
jgi:hypothetical protein